MITKANTPQLVAGGHKAWAAGYLTRGVRYQDRGRDFERLRLDCWGFVMLVQRERFGRELPSMLETYDTAEDPSDTGRAVDTHRIAYRRIEDPRDAEPGDLVVMNLAGYPAHVGVYVGGNRVLQLRRHGVTLDDLTPPHGLSRRVEGYFRCP